MADIIAAMKRRYLVLDAIEFEHLQDNFGEVGVRMLADNFAEIEQNFL